jgi:hypothetical protein
VNGSVSLCSDVGSFRDASKRSSSSVDVGGGEAQFPLRKKLGLVKVLRLLKG